MVSVFVYGVSGHSFIHLQRSANGEETIAAKRDYELMKDSHGVSVRSFRTDNGIYAEESFRYEVARSNQTITFCGVGAHHQNGSVEKHIGRMMRGSRTNLLHAQRCFSEAIG